MKMKSENKIIIAICLFTVLLFTVSLLVSGHSITSVQHRDRSAPSGAQISRADGHLADSAVSDRGARVSSFSAGREQSPNHWNLKVKVYFDSILAVLFKIAVIPCVILLMFHFVRDVNTLLWRIVFGFVHEQDGKKRTGAFCTVL